MLFFPVLNLYGCLCAARYLETFIAFKNTAASVSDDGGVDLDHRGFVDEVLVVDLEGRVAGEFVSARGLDRVGLAEALLLEPGRVVIAEETAARLVLERAFEDRKLAGLEVSADHPGGQVLECGDLGADHILRGIVVIALVRHAVIGERFADFVRDLPDEILRAPALVQITDVARTLADAVVVDVCLNADDQEAVLSDEAYIVEYLFQIHRYTSFRKQICGRERGRMHAAPAELRRGRPVELGEALCERLLRRKAALERDLNDAPVGSAEQ